MLNQQQQLLSADVSIVCGLDAPDIIREETLADIFRQTALQNSDKPCADYQAERLTYGEMNHLTERLATVLSAKKMGRRMRVCIWMERSICLHATVLAITKTGAAWIPLDACTPFNRVETVVCDAQAVAVITDKPLDSLHLPPDVAVYTYQDLLDEANQIEFVPVIAGALPDDPAYLIYTSGSTGKPKGIEITHRNVCHLLRSENLILGIHGNDVVWQGFSPSFDMWLEEVAISWLVGAHIKIATQADMQALDMLSDRLEEAGVTVLHCVPSMLGTIHGNLPTVRLLNMGGEACQAHLVDRFWHLGRHLYNSYGPTETTVTATMTALRPGDPITIGVPLPNYRAYIVDEHGRPVESGKQGELVIGGPGVGLGYIGRPELTAQKFIENTLDYDANASPMLYKTGDAASLDNHGRIEFHGRLDDQVKLRGFRIELGEIESVLSNCEGVAAAAVVVRKDAAGMDQLAAFIVRDFPELTTAQVRQDLKKSLPVYMLPTAIVFMETMPRLASGKIDRKGLPQIDQAPGAMANDGVLQNGRTPFETDVMACCSKLFGGAMVAPTDDFFNDIGGHSLLVAALVTELRRDVRYRKISIGDVYRLRTLENIARHLETLNICVSADSHESLETTRISQWKYTLCGVAQTSTLPFIFAIIAFEFLGPYLVDIEAINEGHGTIVSLCAAFLAFMLATPLVMGLSIAAKWLLLGQVKAGDYPLWGNFYYRWWVVQQLRGLVPITLISKTPLYRLYLRAMGAQIGSDVYLGSTVFDAPDLVRIGKNTSFGSHSAVLCANVSNGFLRLRAVKIGESAYIGSSACVTGGCKMGDWSELGDLSLLPHDAEIPAGEAWTGSPAKFDCPAQSDDSILPASPARKLTFAAVQLLLLTTLPMALFVPLLPVLYGLSVLEPFYLQSPALLLGILPVFAVVYITSFAGFVAVLKMLILPQLKPGQYRTDSMTYLRKWLVDELLSLSLGVLHPIYASLYASGWLRLLGAKIGARTEVSTIGSVLPNLLTIGEEAFVADHVMVGDTHVRFGWMTVRETAIARRTFLGNGAVLPDGAHVPSDVLLGCLSTGKAQALSNVEPGSTWFGSPAISIPKREMFEGFPESLTFRPNRLRIISRLSVETCRIVLPTLVYLCSGLLLTHCLDNITDHYSITMAALALTPLFILCTVLPSFLITVSFKWLAVGQYKPKAMPMWTAGVWFSEAVTTTYEALAVPMLLSYLTGTPLMSFCLRALGVKVGKHTYINTTDITEYDCVKIGDAAVLDFQCGPQTHLFEDRIMKIGRVQIGNHANMGARAIALYGSTMEDAASLAPLSMVMKGETLPSHTAWIGSPCKPV